MALYALALSGSALDWWVVVGCGGLRFSAFGNVYIGSKGVAMSMNTHLLCSLLFLFPVDVGHRLATLCLPRSELVQEDP